MKRLLILLLLIISFNLTFAQQVYKTIMHDSITREYLEYVPSSYNGTKSVPLVICLHGLGDTIENFANIGMNYVADTANFIVLTPEALNSPFGTAWNSGASYMGNILNQTVDDVGFIRDLIDSTAALYNIDTNNVFVTGFSMGGFMSNRLACELNSRIRAIASVSGTIGNSLSCNPPAAIPVCHFHGTSDQTVAYTGNMYGNDAEELVNYWVTNDNCDTIPIIDSIPDTANDGKTVVHYSYLNGDNNSEVEFYKIINGAHEWLFLPNNDISYTLKIWNFFRKNMYVSSSSINNNTKNVSIKIYPNPSIDKIEIKTDLKNISNIEIYDIYGKKLLNINPSDLNKQIDLNSLYSGVYILKLKSANETIIKKFIKQ